MKCGLKGQQGLTGVRRGFVNEVMCEKWVPFGYAQIYQGNHDLTMNNLRYKFDCDSLIMCCTFDLSILFQSFKYYIWDFFSGKYMKSTHRWPFGCIF